MNFPDFQKAKDELKTLARSSVVFLAQPDNLREFEVEIDKLEETPGTRKLVGFLIDLFKEIKERVDNVVSIVKETRAKMAE